MHFEIHEAAIVSIDAVPARDTSSLQLHVSSPLLDSKTKAHFLPESPAFQLILGSSV